MNTFDLILHIEHELAILFPAPFGFQYCTIFEVYGVGMGKWG
jgi:hypothetical protein